MTERVRESTLTDLVRMAPIPIAHTASIGGDSHAGPLSRRSPRACVPGSWGTRYKVAPSARFHCLCASPCCFALWVQSPRPPPPRRLSRRASPPARGRARWPPPPAPATPRASCLRHTGSPATCWSCARRAAHRRSWARGTCAWSWWRCASRGGPAGEGGGRGWGGVALSSGTPRTMPPRGAAHRCRPRPNAPAPAPPAAQSARPGRPLKA